MSQSYDTSEEEPQQQQLQLQLQSQKTHNPIFTQSLLSNKQELFGENWVEPIREIKQSHTNNHEIETILAQLANNQAQLSDGVEQIKVTTEATRDIVSGSAEDIKNVKKELIKGFKGIQEKLKSDCENFNLTCIFGVIKYFLNMILYIILLSFKIYRTITNILTKCLKVGMAIPWIGPFFALGVAFIECALLVLFIMMWKFILNKYHIMHNDTTNNISRIMHQALVESIIGSINMIKNLYYTEAFQESFNSLFAQQIEDLTLVKDYVTDTVAGIPADLAKKTASALTPDFSLPDFTGIGNSLLGSLKGVFDSSGGGKNTRKIYNSKKRSKTLKYNKKIKGGTTDLVIPSQKYDVMTKNNFSVIPSQIYHVMTKHNFSVIVQHNHDVITQHNNIIAILLNLTQQIMEKVQIVEQEKSADSLTQQIMEQEKSADSKKPVKNKTSKASSTNPNIDMFHLAANNINFLEKMFDILDNFEKKLDKGIENKKGGRRSRSRSSRSRSRRSRRSSRGRGRGRKVRDVGITHEEVTKVINNNKNYFPFTPSDIKNAD